MGEKFTKRIMKWGLLRRVAESGKPWSFVNQCENIFDTETAAFAKANYFNVEVQDIPHYLYKPVEVLLEVEIDRFLSTKGEPDAKPIP